MTDENLVGEVVEKFDAAAKVIMLEVELKKVAEQFQVEIDELKRRVKWLEDRAGGSVHNPPPMPPSDGTWP
jgi:hypothetical protein